MVKLADLVHYPRPFTAASSFSFISNPPPPQRPTDGRVLAALNSPTILVGTLTLPSHTALSSSSPPCSCFRFSDGSATVCCDVLHFHAGAIGKAIRVTAFNFIPLKHHGGRSGFLEIIKWCFYDSNEGLNQVDSLPLVLNHPGSSCCRGGGSDGSRGIHGVVESVGPVSVVPCAMAASSSDLNSGSKVNLPGFLVQLMCCECMLCDSKELVNNLMSGSSMENGIDHSFTKMEIVYFCGNASSWHPAITKLIGNRIVVSGLKKKLVYITKEESCVMYVTVDTSVLRVCPCSEKWLPRLKCAIKGKGECGVYTGIIKGVYMQGMALELDHDVWLLLTDELHTLIHGLRVGSIISVRNVHFMDPKFSWTKIIILGACVKTSIIVESFSPLETVVLLLVSSLRKKFAGILSDKEILGSKHKEGLAQTYSSSLLPPSVFQTQHGAFMGLCRRHDLNGCSRELHCGFLKMVIPISIFTDHCIDTLIRMMKSENHCKLLPVGSHFSILSREARYNGRSVRRFIPSEEVGVVLLGHLKIDPLNRRLQLVDATGGIDVLIPDLPFTWNPNKIYEKGVLGGKGKELGILNKKTDSSIE
ncbi:CST complex subunit CTC1-like [Gastrolobium bilobum]|uniref:CST complex subunit CTC1-like n=1 Tax=Gastrolobium bilobum TaxID=150636 RepID=UPI002AB1EB17|nr:CST complex subunit CTC1-like [Gastrolobium bilobum]